MKRSLLQLPQKRLVAIRSVEKEEVIALQFQRNAVAIRLCKTDRKYAVVPQLLRVKQTADQTCLPADTQSHVGQFVVAEAALVSFRDYAENEVGFDQLAGHPCRPVFVGLFVSIDAALAAISSQTGTEPSHAFRVLR